MGSDGTGRHVHCILAMTIFNETRVYDEDLYYTYDLLKNTTALLGIQAGRRALYEYGAYGNVVKMEGNAAQDNPFRFSSEYADDELGLVYYNYRYYNTIKGRWLNREPIGEDGDFNLYRMVYNNLFTFIDYTGSIAVKTPDAAISNSPSYVEDIARATRGITSSSNISRRAARAAAVIISTRKGCKPCKPPAGSKRHEIANPGSRERGVHKCDPYRSRQGMDDESGSISIVHMQLEWSCYLGKHTNSTRRKYPGWPFPS